jgi:hypothetical protein
MGKSHNARPSDPGARTEALPPAWRRRGTVVAVGGLTLLVLLLTIGGRSAGIVISRLIVDGSFLLLWLLAAGGYGSLVPLPRDEHARSLRLITTVSLGLGIVGLLELTCGSAGLLHGGVAFTLIAVGVVLALWRMRKLDRRDVAPFLRADAASEWLWLLALPVLAMAIVAAYVPPGVLWSPDEPHGYDVVEYHLQLPREFYELGRTTPLRHNVFSYFPLGVEMHSLLAMQLRGGPWAGMYLAQLMHATFVALSVVAVYAVARPFGSKASATVAAVAAANVPWLPLLAPIAYNEGGLLLYGTLAIGWALRAFHDHAAPRDWLLAGAFAGLACGVKLTAVPQLLLLVPVIIGAVAILRRQPAARVITGAVACVVLGLIVFSPWLIRDFVATRNPVFPEAQSLLGRGHFSETQAQRWSLAHSPPAAQRPIGARLTAAWDQIARDWRFAYVLLPLGLAAAALNFRRPEGKALLALLIAWLIFWLGFTHLQGRFYVLAIPVAALGVALMRSREQLYVAGLLVLVQIVCCLHGMTATFGQRVAALRDNQLLSIEDLKPILSDEVQAVLDRSEPVALIGDARAFLYPIAMSRLRYRTVFDVDVKPGESLISAWLGPDGGSPWLIVDPLELERFSRTYYGIPAPAPDFPGPRDRVFILQPQR